MRFSLSRQLRMQHSGIDVLFSFFFRRGLQPTDLLLRYIWSMIRVTLSLIRATPFQLFTFCLLIHLNTERESIEKNVGSVANKRMLVRIWNIANVGGVLLTTSILHLVGMSCI